MVDIMGKKFIPGKKSDLYRKKIKQLYILIGRNQAIKVNEAKSGQIIAISGIHQYIEKTATIQSIDAQHSVPLANIEVLDAKYVQAIVRPNQPQFLPVFAKNLKILANTNLQLQT